MTTTIIIGLLLSFVTGSFCTFKAIQIGLRWQLQTNNKQEPVLNSPVAPLYNAMHKAKVDDINKYSKEQMREWMYGE